MRLIVQIDFSTGGFDLLKGRISGEVAEWFGVGRAGDASADGAGWVEVDLKFDFGFSFLLRLLRLLLLLLLAQLENSYNPTGMISMPMRKDKRIKLHEVH